jgi:hypothetical protein
MDTPSLEQQTVINDLLYGKNVVVNAVAGSGKSTCVISAALQMPELNFNQVTYNASLRTDTLAKIDKIGVTNMMVHTYHSLAVSHYHPNAHTDIELRRILRENLPIQKRNFMADILVLDESQDMTPLYFAFIVKYIRDINHPFQILILGDHKQCLYEFKGADARFLLKAADIWSHCPLLKSPAFEQRTLQTSYRITNQMADFVNDVMLGEQRMHAVREGSKVIYLRNSEKLMFKIVIHTIKQLIQEGVKPQEIFVLGPSMKKSIRKLENAFVDAGIPCYIPSDDNNKIEDKVIAGKLVFSTFHSVKGRQRPYVIVTQFDHSYFKVYGQSSDPLECPNAIYVACTRATNTMICLEKNGFNTDRAFDFLKMEHMTMREQPYIDFRGIPQTVVWEDSKKEDLVKKHEVAPTELIKFVKEEILEEITPILERIFICENSESEETIDMPSTIETTLGLHEDVSDINGVTIPAIYADAIDPSGGFLLYNQLSASLLDDYPYLKNLVKEMTKEKTIANYLYMANLYIAVHSKLYSKIRQISRDEYNWLEPAILEKCLQRLKDHVDVSGMPEQSIIEYADNESHALTKATLMNHPEMQRQFGDIHHFTFSACVDMITQDIIWELKCTSTITPEHFLQVIIYAWIWRTVYVESKTFKILNIKTGLIYRLESTYEELTDIVVKLLVGKYGVSEPRSDPNFIESCVKQFGTVL